MDPIRFEPLEGKALGSRLVREILGQFLGAQYFKPCRIKYCCKKQLTQRRMQAEGAAILPANGPLRV